MENGQYKRRFDEILSMGIKSDATDIHISAGRPPIFRIDGKLVAAEKYPVLSPEDTQELAFTLLSEEQKKKFLSPGDIYLSTGYNDKARFWINVYSPDVACAGDIFKFAASYCIIKCPAVGVSK